MRSPLAAVLIIVNLVLVLGVALLLVQSAGMRGDLNAARAEITDLRLEVDSLERGVPISELSMRLGELENDVRAWVVAFSGDIGGSGSGGGSGLSAEDRRVILDRLDEVLDEIEALGRRVDAICEGVPVC